jgi:beta-phosphoglucomutase-like phosphatase (HAD superfamily)
MKQLRRFFSVVASTQDVGKTKPAPDVFLHAARLLGVPTARCCVIEDSAAGVTAARAAGMEVIAITNSLPRERLVGATHIVDTYAEIERLLVPTSPGPALEPVAPTPASPAAAPATPTRHPLM